MIKSNIDFKYFVLVFVLCFHFKPLFAQSLELSIEASLLRALIIDMEVDFSIDFDNADAEIVEVGPTFDTDIADNATRPAIVRVTGGGAEAVIDIETTNISVDYKKNDDTMKLFDFNIINEAAGSSTSLMPDPSAKSFLLSVGGKVNISDKEEISSSVNIININYL